MNVPFVVLLAAVLFIEIKMKGQQWPGVILGAMLVAALDPASPIMDLLHNVNAAAESAATSIIQGIGEML